MSCDTQVASSFLVFRQEVQTRAVERGGLANRFPRCLASAARVLDGDIVNRL